MNITTTINERIADLRVERNFTQKYVAEKTSIPASTLSRIERGEITNISNEIIEKLADFYHISTDYLHGRTALQTARNIELSELGISNKALFVLLSGRLNINILNRILEHSHFPMFLDSADAYFTDVHSAGLQARNDIINLATASLDELKAGNSDKSTEINHDIRRLNAEKISNEEADLTKLRNIMTTILKDIKKNYGENPVDISTKQFQDMLSGIKEQTDLVPSDSKRTAEEMMKMVIAATLSQLEAVGLDETETRLLAELMEHLMKRQM